MFIRNQSNVVILSSYDNVLPRYQKQILLITHGDENNNNIVFSFESDKIIKLINFLEKNDIKFDLDTILLELMNNYHGKAMDFSQHAKKALDIKNNFDNAPKGYIEFITVIKKELTRTLYEHQLKASYHMAYSLNSCNFSVPGAGKTSIVYAAYAYLKKVKKVDKLLIIGPLSASMAWENEYFECFNKSPDYMNLSKLDNSEKNEYFRKFREIQAEITFINYESFNTTKKSINDFFDKNSIMIVLDEAHKIKNPNAKRSLNIMKFAEKAVSRVVLTGTPIPNGYIDLYNLFEFIWPDKNIVGYNKNQLKKIDESVKFKENVQQLMNNIDPFYIRISKDTLMLPKAIFNPPIEIEMGTIQKKIYDFIVNDFLSQEMINIDENLLLELKKAKLIRLMQTLTNPASLCQSLDKSVLKDSTMLELICNYEKFETPPKYEKMLSLVKDIINRDGKVIIWTQYVYNLLGLKNFLRNYGIESELLYGNVDNIEREKIIKKFHTEDDFRVIIANPAAVAESISLHKACHNAIYMDMSFNASHYMQSKDRIHRVGLADNIETNYYFTVSKSTVDNIIYNRVLEKESTMLNIIEGKEVPLFSKEFEFDLSDVDIKIISDYLKKER